LTYLRPRIIVLTSMVSLPRPFLAALALGCATGVVLTSPGRAQTPLPKSSPFMSAGATAGPAGAAGEVIEFAAVRTIGAHTEIDLYDTQGKKNHWIPLGGTVDGMTVVGYDARRDQVTATIGGVNKVLKLRQPRGVIAGNAAVNLPAAVSFAAPSPSSMPQIQPPAPAATAAPVAVPATDGTLAPGAPAATPAQPAAPLSVARQEEEARMLVSDLLEIGMAQRKAYEEKQKQAANPNATPAGTETPTGATPPTPNGPPTSG
jgi:hypothetical protein